MNKTPGGQVLVTLILFLCGGIFSSSNLNAADSTSVERDSAIARVLEFNTIVTVNRSEQKTVTNEMLLFAGDTLSVPENGSVTLLFRDGRVKQITGPARTTVSAGMETFPDKLLTRLTSALLNLFFAGEKEQEDAYLFVRDPMNNYSAPVSVPPLVFPPDNCRLVDVPSQLRWQPVKGVYIYRVSIYDNHKLLWEGTTNQTTLDIPTGTFKFEPGNTYLWMVEARVGEVELCSQQADFYVLSDEERITLNQQLAEITGAPLDDKLKSVLRIQFYRDRNLKLACYREIQMMLNNYPDDYSTLIMKAELLREMGFFEEAVEVYRNIVR
ncbi:MAG: hypothetical protein JXA92_14545 [candidate division Zixibacteria bacterium]|nr:hypothetical protein [candidate division Zixibacteria bacterium]